MRALKQFLKQKKGYCERQECKCNLISLWRDYQGHPEYCNCGYKKESTANMEEVQTPAVQSQGEETVSDSIDFGRFGELPDGEADVVTLDDLNS